MEYFKATWFHYFEDEPGTFYTELDDNRFETRKIEVFKDGSFGMASQAFSFGGCKLADQSLPGIEEINGDTQFMAAVITKDEFEKTWFNYANYLRPGSAKL